MIKNYLKTALRNLWRHKGATVIKLAGLSIGICCCLLILAYLTDELSYNRWNARYADIYRVNFIKNGDGQFRKMAGTPASGGPAIAKDIPQVAAVARIYIRGGILATIPAAGARPGDRIGGPRSPRGETRRFEEENIFFADNSLAEIFTLHWRQGLAADALAQPNSIVLTTAMAKKYFGDGPALGRTLVYEDSVLLRVTGVIDPVPRNSDIRWDALVSFPTLYAVERKPVGDFIRDNWLYNPCETFVLLRPGQAVAPVEAALRQLTVRYGDERVQKSYYFSLQPWSDNHLRASDVEGSESSNSITYIYIFGGIALLILLIANINFINLSNAQSLTRIAEVGIRKVSGAGSRQLLLQFLGEGLLVSCLAALMAMLLAVPGLSLLNAVTDKALESRVLWSGIMIPALVGLLVCTGFLAGLYPAVYITRWRLTALLKGKTGKSAGSGRLIRQSLIVTQFAVAAALIIGATVIQRQLTFMRNKPLGFDKSQVLVLPLFGKNPSPFGGKIDSAQRARMNAFEADLGAYPAISAVTTASGLPGDPAVRGLVIPEGHTDRDNIFIPWVSVDYDYLPAMGMTLVAGRDFSKAAGTDHLQAFIINESAVKAFGWASPEAAIGKKFTRGDSRTGKKGYIIGVVKDFNFDKLDQPLQPMVMDVNVPRFNLFAIRIRPDHVPATIAAVQRVWNKYFPQRIFDYSFLDENINSLYKAQENLSRLVRWFAAIAIFISCIGLFGLASFITIQRTKEISIRKVLGASVPGLIYLLYKDFLRLVIVALVIASPVAAWLMNKWLHDFAFRIPLSAWIFVLAAVLAIAISFATVGWQGLRAARVEPAKNLRAD
ncbi:MAG TPA: ABC transporter permease [Puia sp.]|nr:ABC transporter permease [Puia sp.]